jgi:hypothetical protein
MDEEEVIDALGIRDRVGTFLLSSPNSWACFGPICAKDQQICAKDQQIPVINR